MPITIAIADDHTLFRQGLRSLMALETDIEVVAETDQAGAIAAILDELAPQILLLDLQMDRSTINDICAHADKTTVVVLTASEADSDGMAALRAGATGVVQKRFAVETLMTAVRAAAAGETWMPPALQAAYVREHASPAPRLTVRETEIVRCVAMGLRNAEIASRLEVAESTIKTHLTNVFQKLEIRDRIELARFALKRGLVGLHDN